MPLSFTVRAHMISASGPGQRPLGVTLISIVLGWLALAGLGNAVLSHGWGSIFAAMALLYGVAALASCVGLWRMSPWANRAYLAWCVSVIALGVWLVRSRMFGDLLLGTAFLIGVVAVLALGYWSLRGKLRWAPAL